MKSLKELIIILIGILFMLLLCADWSGTMRAGALSEDVWYYQHFSQMVTFWGTDVERVEALFEDALIKEMDTSALVMRPELWRQNYSATWFINNRVVHWFTFNYQQSNQTCVLITMLQPTITQIDRAIEADCGQLAAFHVEAVQRLMDTLPSSTPLPQG